MKMNINKLYKGQSFKNYKELCSVLEMEVKKSTDTKNAQFKELSRYCNYNKIGHKFTIEEVYDVPMPKIENRGKSSGSRNYVYGEIIQLLILDLLAKCRNGQISISRTKLMVTINMINRNYAPLGEKVKQLGIYTDIEEAVIYDFYNTSNSNFKSAVETALNNLMDKRVIWYDMITKVCEKEIKSHRHATVEEKEIIRDTEKYVLDELGYKQVSQVRCSKNWKLFKKKVKKLLNENSEIKYYYMAYDIFANQSFLKEEQLELINFLMDELKRDEYRGELNATVYFNLIENAKKRHEKGFTSGKMSKYRLTDTYVEDIKKLVSLLIDNMAEYIVNDVIDIKDDEIWTEEELDLFEQLIG
jgi:Rps23 Pro-64 3,4-dihydroxylase Tpa1-like proline 4-hydroxylase